MGTFFISIATNLAIVQAIDLWQNQQYLFEFILQFTRISKWSLLLIGVCSEAYFGQNGEKNVQFSRPHSRLD